MSQQQVIDKLTPEQEAKIPHYVEKYRKIGLDTSPVDKAKAEDAVAKSYDYMKYGRPKFIWADSPIKGAQIAACLANNLDHTKDKPTQEMVREQANKASFGSFEAYWVSLYDFIASELPVQHDNLIDIVKEIVVECGVYWTFQDYCVMTLKPVAIHMKDNKLHNPDGLALEYPDGTGIFALEGVRYKSLMDIELNKAFDGQQPASLE